MRNFFTTIASLLGLLVLCNSIKAHAQDVVTVDPTTGNAIVTIPLNTLMYGSISIPINLTHQSNAISVREGEGDAGMGWTLSCNYGVFREVRGLPDEVIVGTTRVGWTITDNTIQSFTPSSNDNLTDGDWTDETSDYNTINYNYGTRDTEPDLYTIVGPNLYARFVTLGNSIKLLEYQDIQVIALSSNGGFTVTNNLGHVYQFTLKETLTRSAKAYKDAVVDMFMAQYDYYKDDLVPAFATAWYLTSVTDENGLVTNFNYSAQNKVRSNRFITRIKETTNSPDTLYTIADELTPQRLSSITAGRKTATFTWSEGDLLARINVSESTFLDSYQYGFTYLNAYQVLAGGNTNHSFLADIEFFSPLDCRSQLLYRFAYTGVGNSSGSLTKSVDFSWKKLYAQDMWGYYNGVFESGANSYLNVVPTINFHNNQSDSRRFTFHSIPGITDFPLAGTNRNTKPAKIDIGTLSRITYPTGGYTKIEYERNKYYDTLASIVLYGPGLRVKSITTSGGDAAYNRNATTTSSYHDIVKTYFYERSATDTTSSGIIFYPPSYGLSTGKALIRTLENQAPLSQTGYKRVKETISGFGSKVYIYSYPARYPFTTYSTDWTATKSKIARNPYSHLSLINVQNGYYMFPFAPNPTYSFSQGLLTSVTEFSEAGKKMYEKKIFYARKSPALASVYGLKFEKFTDCDCYHFSKYEIITGTTNVVTQEVVKIGDDQATPVYSTTTRNFYYNSSADNILLNSIEVVNEDGSVSRQYIKYVKDFASITSPTTNDLMANAIKLMNTARRHAEVVERYTMYTPFTGATPLVNNASLQTFKDFGSGKVYPWQTYSLPQGVTFTAAAVVTGSTQGFSSDSDYYLKISQDDFDAQANPVSISDEDKNIVGLHYAQDYTLPPVAKFSKATAKQTVYDGFEIPTGRSLTATTALTYVTGWTGERAAVLESSNSLYNNSVDNNGKAYRISCYVKASQNATVTFKFINPSTSAVLYTTNLSYAPFTLNTWTYLEGSLPVTSTSPAQVKLTVTSNVTINIDDLIVMPAQAIVNTQTFLPLKGSTSQTDDRGYSNTATYDVLSRKTASYDRQRNLVEFNEYTSKGGVILSYISSEFKVTQLSAGLSFTATAPDLCFSSPQYEWKVDDVIAGSNAPTLTSTISSPGPHKMSLKVTNPNTGASKTTVKDVCVLTSGKTFSFTNDLVNNELCNVQASPGHFTVTPLVYCGGTAVIAKCVWQTSTDGGATWFTESETGTTLTKSGYNPGYTWTSMIVKVTVIQTCQGGQDARCNDSTIPAMTDSFALTIKDCRS